MMHNGTIPRIAAPLSLGLTVAFLALLTGLHVLEPEFNSGHLISEYQLGDYGFLMSLAFCFLGAGALLLALSLGPRLRTRGGRVGWWGLLVIGAAFFIAGIFPPVQTPAIIGYLHGISGLVAIFGSPIAFTLIGRSLARSEGQSLLTRRLRWATLVAWGGLWLFLASLIVTSLTGQMDRPLPPWVSLANRFLIVTYCIWFITAARSATRVRPAGGQTS
jgi:quinol-cytochrome oxidoreductase complex cytochrome b subunit